MAFTPADSDELRTAVGEWGATNWDVAFTKNGSPPEDWDTINVTDMSWLFGQGMAISPPNANSFNSDKIANWNTANVTNMVSMFRSNSQFNQNISNWNTSSVTEMASMFRGCPFNQDISTRSVTVDGTTYAAWSTANVTNMDSMFLHADFFNQDIGNWNVGSVTNMAFMFANSTFNQDIGNWNVGSVTSMQSMFMNNPSFNYSLKNWNVSNVVNFSNIFHGTTGLLNLSHFSCGQHWAANAAFQATTYYDAAAAASGCDPYVMTLTGELYKLDNITGVCRMMQGTVKGKPFVINAMMRLDSENKERQMNEWSSKNAGGLETSNLEMQSFYTHVFVKHGDSECIVDLENGTVRGTPETDLVIKPISGKHSEIPMYNREVCSGGCSIRAGPVVVFAKMFPNRQVRSEIATCGGRAVKNADGFAVRPMRTKVCRVKKLTDGGMLTMKRSHYKGEVRERFYSTADKEGKVRTIPRV